MDAEIAQWVRLSLAFHNLNKSAETKFGLSLVQYHLLVTLRDMPGCSPQSLAGTLGMHPSSVTQSVRRLQKKKAVSASEDPKDSRKKMLTLTRDGVGMLDQFSLGIGKLLDSKDYRKRLKVGL